MTDTLFLFAHGAGAPSSSAWMQAWSERLGELGTVVRFDYPYMQRGRRAPDRLPVLIQAHREALAEARQRHPGRVALIGKSMGSRVGCHLSLEEPVDRLICLGYPLKGAGKSGKLRDEVLLALDTPILFIQGTRDPLCPLELLEDVRKKMTAPSEQHVVEAGNHSLEVTRGQLKRAGESQQDVDARILEAIRRFVS